MRWADLDQLGHVNNVVYVDFLQEARVDILRGRRARPRERSQTGSVVPSGTRVPPPSSR